MNYFEGLNDQEVYDLVQNESEYELRIAEMNPSLYIAGLEHSTFLMKTKNLRAVDIDFKDYHDQLTGLEFSRRVSETEDIAYDYHAYLLGQIAGASKPLEHFVIKGLLKTTKNKS